MDELPVEIVRSPRRKRTVQAYVAGGRLRVLVPAGLSPAKEAELVESVVAKVMAKRASIDLADRALYLSEIYGLPQPKTIVWSDRQLARWGSCTHVDGRIRISRRLATMPVWVLDWVVIHELAHLEVPDHGKRFQELVARYPLGERAEGYLIAKSEELQNGQGRRAAR